MYATGSQRALRATSVRYSSSSAPVIPPADPVPPAALPGSLEGTDADGVTGVRLRSTVDTNQTEELDVSGYFAAIGHTPNTALFKGQLDTDSEGYLVTRNGTTYCRTCGKVVR